MPHSMRNNGLIERRVRWTFYLTFVTGQLAAEIVQFNVLRLFFVGYVKAQAYTDKPGSINALEDNIKAFIREIPADMLKRVRQKFY